MFLTLKAKRVAPPRASLGCGAREARRATVVCGIALGPEVASLGFLAAASATTVAGGKWFGVALVGTLLLGAPWSAERVLVLHSLQWLVSGLGSSAVATGVLKWGGIAHARSGGRLYCGPT